MSFRPSASIEALRSRAKLTCHLREFFSSEGFWEVETPLWSRDTCVDTWIDPVSCGIAGCDEGFLQTSPEFHMKRLLSAGADSIWSLTRSFRAGEAGDLHNPEFSIVEWYKVGEDHNDAMDRTERLLRMIAQESCLQLDEEPFARITYYDAFATALGERVEHMTAAELAKLANQCAPHVNGPLDRDGWLNVLLSEVVEPWLKKQRCVFLTDYPASQAALAKTRDGVPPTADRFELYVHGIELANGYNELTDPEELRRRFEIHNKNRVVAGLAPLPNESHLLDAMAHGLPSCAGVALGWDRIVMLALGKSYIRDVLSFAIDRA